MSRMRFGIAKELEAEADRLIHESLQGVTSHAAKSDILTPWKERDRKRREVYVFTGTPDSTLRQGTFHRVANRGNPDLNSRDGMARNFISSRQANQ